jgi:hypothetical protein
MAEKTYRQKCAEHFDRTLTKKELIWKYIQLAEAHDALVKVMKFNEEMKQ